MRISDTFNSPFPLMDNNTTTRKGFLKQAGLLFAGAASLVGLSRAERSPRSVASTANGVSHSALRRLRPSSKAVARPDPS